jgi:hypothetical protein
MLNVKIKQLRDKMFEVTSSQNHSQTENEKLAYALFVEMSLQSVVMGIIKQYESKDYSFSEIQRCFYIPKEMIHLSKDVELNPSSAASLKQAFGLYLDIVREAPAFTDVLSLLQEEIYLTAGRGKRSGQFFTPHTLAAAMAKLMPPTHRPDEPIVIAEVCCGSGALVLAPLSKLYADNPDALKDVSILMNDIDTLSVKAALLQILSSSFMHDIELREIQAYNANLITEWKIGEMTLFCYRRPTAEPMVHTAVAEFVEMMRFLHESHGEACPA